MRDWLTEEEERREKRGTWKLKLEFGLFGLALALPVLATIKGWIGD
jgi:hypothetical protein